MSSTATPLCSGNVAKNNVSTTPAAAEPPVSAQPVTFSAAVQCGDDVTSSIFATGLTTGSTNEPTVSSPIAVYSGASPALRGSTGGGGGISAGSRMCGGTCPRLA